MAEIRDGAGGIAERFAADGYCFLVEVLSPGEAADARAQLVALEAAGRGEDRFGHFREVPPPDGDLTAEARARHGRIRASQNEALYAGADEGPS